MMWILGFALWWTFDDTLAGAIGNPGLGALPWWVVLLALAPVLHVGYFFPSYLLPYLTMATSVEQHRQPHIAQKTFHEMQAEKTLRVLKTLALLQSHAKGLHRKKDKSERTSTAAEREAEAMKRMSKDELGELRQAFDLFDVDGSGTIDKHELEGLLQSLGEQHTPSELAGIMAELGGDDGEMSFGEFCVAMSDTDEEGAAPSESALVAQQRHLLSKVGLHIPNLDRLVRGCGSKATTIGRNQAFCHIRCVRLKLLQWLEANRRALVGISYSPHEDCAEIVRCSQE